MVETTGESKTCLHSSCRCPAEGDGESYCSDACRTDHVAGTMRACHCGHEGCEAGAA